MTKIKNPWREIEPKNDDGAFKAVIEIPKGSQNKYELNLDSGAIELEKKLKPEQTFIFNYGFIPQTLGGDSDPLDIVVLSDDKLSQSAVVNVKLIGVMRMIDEDDVDDKLIGVLVEDMYWKENINNADIVKQEFKKIENWFRAYKKINGTKLEIVGFELADPAIKEVEKAMVNYEKKFSKNNSEFNYKQYDKKELFGPFFWFHLFLELIFIVSPFFFSWKLILLGVISLELQFVIFGGCLINRLHFSKDKEAVFLYPYLKMLGVDISYQNAKMLMRYVAPTVILVMAIFWQIVMKNVPIINFGV